jgi:hypothetical protein
MASGAANANPDSSNLSLRDDGRAKTISDVLQSVSPTVKYGRGITTVPAEQKVNTEIVTLRATV